MISFYLCICSLCLCKKTCFLNLGYPITVRSRNQYWFISLFYHLITHKIVYLLLLELPVFLWYWFFHNGASSRKQKRKWYSVWITANSIGLFWILGEYGNVQKMEEKMKTQFSLFSISLISCPSDYDTYQSISLLCSIVINVNETRHPTIKFFWTIHFWLWDNNFPF